MKVLSLIAGTVFMAVTANAVADVFNMQAEFSSIAFVPVGNPGNLADTRQMNDGTSGYGSVGYTFGIGLTEVTAAQYVEFLNAVAATDAYGLYNTRMADPVFDVGCNIQRLGAPGSFTYSVAADWANRPVNYVSFGDAMRFANWLTNEQPSGIQDGSTTENGSYAISGATETPSLLAIARKADARYVIPTEDEWHKVAYHKNDGATGNYWIYPTQSDSAPSVSAPPGQSGSSGSANYKLAQGSTYYLSEAGAYTDSESAYGTFDQGGSLWEWNEAMIANTTYRGTRGGSWLSNSDVYLRSDRRYGFSPVAEYNFIGFRVASVPEPASLLFLAMGAGFLFLRNRRHE